MIDSNLGTLWQSLTPQQQKEVLEAFDKSDCEENLVPLSEIKSKFTENFRSEE